MDVVHRMSLSPERDRAALAELEELGVVLIPVGGTPDRVLLMQFDIAESNPQWQKVEAIAKAAGLPSVTEKRFTEAEIRAAAWLHVRPNYMWGYPMPDGDPGFKRVSFDAASECPVCGTGLRQVAPLRLKREPVWRSRTFLGIYWLLSICARSDVAEAMRKRGLSGFEATPILEHRSGNPLSTVVQLRFPHELSEGLMDENLVRETPACGHRKYLGATRELYRVSRAAMEGCLDFVQTPPWFGSGHLAVPLVLASSAFGALYLDQSWKGLALEPVELG